MPQISALKKKTKKERKGLDDDLDLSVVEQRKGPSVIIKTLRWRLSSTHVAINISACALKSLTN